MVAESLQIEYTTDEYELYKKWTKDSNGRPIRFKELAFLFVLFKLKNNNHIQCVVSGEFGQGKTSTAISMARWDALFTKRLIKWYEKMGKLKDKDFDHLKDVDSNKVQFRVDDNIVISPEDPTSKFLYSPKRLQPYVIDDGYFFTSTREANTTATGNIVKSITGNRKQNPSMYWIFPNIFKIPTAILETMDIWIHKESLRKGDILIPSRVIQLKEKFAREKVEKYARYPKAFGNLIRLHPSFITKAKFPKVKGRGWKKYLDKYEKYKWKDESQQKEKTNARMDFFRQLEKVLEKNIRVTSTAKAREELIHTLIVNAMKKKSSNVAQINQIADSFTDQFIKWQEDKLAGQLTKDISDSMVSNVQIEMKDDVEPAKEEAG